PGRAGPGTRPIPGPAGSESGASVHLAPAPLGLEREDVRRPVGAFPHVRRGGQDRGDQPVRAVCRVDQHRGPARRVRDPGFERTEPVPAARAEPVPLPRRAVTAESGGAIPGWYGKLPYLGDFASRRLPGEFIRTWDTWLQEVLQATRASLAEEWLDRYLTMPIWRFVLLPGLVEPNAWGGVLMPSVDRVGRQFPLTLAVALPSDGAVAHAVFDSAAWFAHLEHPAPPLLHPPPTPQTL